jgi:hypothetical protein
MELFDVVGVVFTPLDAFISAAVVAEVVLLLMLPFYCGK